MKQNRVKAIYTIYLCIRKIKSVKCMFIQKMVPIVPFVFFSCSFKVSFLVCLSICLGCLCWIHLPKLSGNNTVFRKMCNILFQQPRLSLNGQQTHFYSLYRSISFPFFPFYLDDPPEISFFLENVHCYFFITNIF